MQANSRPKLRELLAVLDAHIAAKSDALTPQLQRAELLAALGDVEEAKKAYLEILKRDPGHFAAWIDMGKLLSDAGFTTAARTAYMAAVNCRPDDPIGHGCLAGILLQEGKLTEARSHYEIALQDDPNSAPAHQGLSAVFRGLGDEQRALFHQRIGFRNFLGNPVPYRGIGPPLPLLVLISPACGNVPYLKLVDDEVFLTATLAPECYEGDLPPHRLIFNAIGDADLCPRSLEAASLVLKKTTAPVINPPAAVSATGRASNAQRLGAIPGVVTPRVAILPRAILSGPDGPGAVNQAGLDFPLLLRSPGFHGGQCFELVEKPEELAAAAAILPGDKLMAIEFMNARGRDGKVRKYRVMIIDGQLYPLHLGISTNWKVHYYSAQMANHPEHQAEEAAFLNDMPGVFGPRTMSALEQVRQTLGLDYGGIDFGLRQDGSVLLFEANATMVMVPPGPGEQWDYRRGAIEKAMQAARRMLVARVESRQGGARELTRRQILP